MFRPALCIGVCVLTTFHWPVPVIAQESAPAIASQAVQVIGITPLPGLGVPLSQVPAPVQSATGRDLERSGARGIADFLQRNFGGVYVNEMQGNPFQPDINYRGYTASPLLGTPQGLSVYLDGVRMNQPFGDVVNWDMIPKNALRTVTLMPGSNPLYGLNTLGGALSLETKDGLSDPGTAINLLVGLFRRGTVEFEHGGANRNGLDWFVAGTAYSEGGWRDSSPTQLSQLFGKLGWGTGLTRVTLAYAYSDSKLTGNGLQEQRFLERQYASVYTKPDITENRSGFLNLTATHAISDDLTFSGNAYYRSTASSTMNGDINEDSLDQAVYQPNAAERAALTAAGYAGFPLAGENAANTPFPFWRCIANVLLRDEPGEKCNALLNRSHTTQRNYGASGQLTWSGAAWGFRHRLTTGAALDLSRMRFDQSTQIGYLNPDRSVTTLNGFADGVTGGNVDGVPFDNRVDLGAATRTASLYASDTVVLGDVWHLTASGRYNHTRVQNRDQINPGGGARSLDGDHSFARFNPALGLTFTPSRTGSAWMGLNQGSRAPTAIELGCANPLQPCRLPNSMAGDPPLKQVIARTLELGARGMFSVSTPGALQWTASLFRAENHDDILFVAAPNQTQFGFFKNVGMTRREGLELGLRGSHGSFTAGAHYSLVNATYQSEETVNGTGNSNNDTAAGGGGSGLDGSIRIRPGDRIPLVPRHQIKLNLDYLASQSVSVGANLIGVGSSYARGNENNAHQPDGVIYLGSGKSPGYAVLNLSARLQIEPALSLHARIDNVFDRKYSSAAQLGSTGFNGAGNFIARSYPAVGGNFPVQQASFNAPGAPRAFWIGMSYRFDAGRG